MFANVEPTPFPGMDRNYVAEMGRALMALKSRRDLLRARPAVQP